MNTIDYKVETCPKLLADIIKACYNDGTINPLISHLGKLDLLDTFIVVITRPSTIVINDLTVEVHIAGEIRYMYFESYSEKDRELFYTSSECASLDKMAHYLQTAINRTIDYITPDCEYIAMEKHIF